MHTLYLIIGLAFTATVCLLTLTQSINSFAMMDGSVRISEPKIPVDIDCENIYFAWWTNNTANGNEEVMFRSSNDGGATFGEKINLSNTTDADSWRVDIAAEGENVLVSWWETNQTDDLPVARLSNDAGNTFGPIIMLAQNGTINSADGDGVIETEDTTDTE